MTVVNSAGREAAFSRDAEVAGRRYRANPRYVLREIGELAATERRALARIADDPGVYGVLMPRDAAPLTVKLVNRDTAELFRTLGAGGRVPEEVRSDSLRLQLADLVAAEILEVEERGVFRSGLPATAPVPTAPATEPLTRLSREAIEYAHGLRLARPADISHRLYAYHRIPAGPAARRRWREGALAAVTRPVVARGPWRGLSHSDIWTSYARAGSAHGDTPARLFKLYVSPLPDHFAETLAAGVDVAAGHDAVVGWKAASGCAGVLRPDKLIIYVASRTALAPLADELRSALAGTPAHGVPFTAALGDDGLLSWGVDPPRFAAGAAGLLSESWRTWLTNRLAAALWQTANQDQDQDENHDQARPRTDAVDLALLRLRAVGVDTGTWTPADTLFADAPRAEA